LGAITVSAVIGQEDMEFEMMVSSTYETVGCCLVMDFFQHHQCDFSIRKGEFYLCDTVIPMCKEYSTHLVACVRLIKDTVIPTAFLFDVDLHPESAPEDPQPSQCNATADASTGTQSMNSTVPL
jgi:hypothetical protein